MTENPWISFSVHFLFWTRDWSRAFFIKMPYFQWFEIFEMRGEIGAFQGNRG